MFSCFEASFHLSIVNRAVIYTPIQLFESSIEVINREDEDNLYFNKELLINNLESYYHDNIDEYLSSYTVEEYFYNQTDGSLCVNDKCNAVEVTVKGSYSFFFNYARTITYEIHQGDKYGQ